VSSPKGREVKSTGRGQIDASRRLQINELPEIPFGGWSNAYEKLREYRKDWRTREVRPPQWVAPKPPEPAGQQCTCGSECAAHPGNQASDGADSRAGDKQMSESSSPPTDRRPENSSSSAAGAQESRTAVRNAEMPGIGDQADQVVTAWVEGRGEQAVPRFGPDKVRRQAVELLAEGMDVGFLCQAAASMAPKGWVDFRKHLQHWTPPSVPAQRGAPGPARTAADCQWCDPRGWYEASNHALTQCRHPDDPPRDHPAAKGLTSGRTE
jgi:hypothetical protein